MQDQLAEGMPAPNKEQLPESLRQWYAWALERSDLRHAEKELCFDPELALQQFDHALFGEAKFAATQMEGAKYTRDSLVLTNSKG